MASKKAGRAKAAEDTAPRSTAMESVLGWLSLYPMSGYDIRQAMENSTEHFWRESFGQIYPALKRLVELGLVTQKDMQPDGQRLRKEYRLTAAGRIRLREWLAEPCGTQVRREELLLKLFFAEKAPKGALREAVAERHRAATAELERYAGIERHLKLQAETRVAAHYWLMTLEFGKAQAAATKQWCEQTMRELDRLEKEMRAPGKDTTKDKGGKA